MSSPKVWLITGASRGFGRVQCDIVKAEPASIEAHLFLVDAYAQADQQQNALRERATAERLRRLDGHKC